jgi:hypothetical protein
MKRAYAALAALFLVATAGWISEAPAQSGWVTLFDGKNLDNWNKLGDANWRLEDGSVVADKGVGFLVSKNSYRDFEIRAEFWADDAANSGIFMRLSDPQKINAENSYEVNIYDGRPDPSYGTGAIVNFAKVSPMPKAGGKWNTFVITAKGSQLTVLFNGQKTVDIQDSKFAGGPFALQYAAGVGGAGVIKWRKVEIRTL